MSTKKYPTTTRATYPAGDLVRSAAQRCRCGQPMLRRPDPVGTDPKKPPPKIPLDSDGQVWACALRFTEPQRFDNEQLDSGNEAHDPAYHVDHFPFPAAT